MTLKNYKQNFCCGINKKFNLIEKIPNISSIFYKKEENTDIVISTQPNLLKSDNDLTKDENYHNYSEFDEINLNNDFVIKDNVDTEITKIKKNFITKLTEFTKEETSSTSTSEIEISISSNNETITRNNSRGTINKGLFSDDMMPNVIQENFENLDTKEYIYKADENIDSNVVVKATNNEKSDFESLTNSIQNSPKKPPRAKIYDSLKTNNSNNIDKNVEKNSIEVSPIDLNTSQSVSDNVNNELNVKTISNDTNSSQNINENINLNTTKKNQMYSNLESDSSDDEASLNDEDKNQLNESNIIINNFADNYNSNNEEHILNKKNEQISDFNYNNRDEIETNNKLNNENSN